MAVAIFQGFSRTISRVMDATALSGSTSASSPHSFVRYSVCTGAEEVLKVLGVDTSLAVTTDGPIPSINDKVKLVNLEKLTSNSVCIVVHASHRLSLSTATTTQLRSGVDAPTGDEKSLRDFFNTYGDSFISEVINGGEYFAMYTFRSYTRDQRMKMITSIQLAGIASHDNVTAALQQALDTVVSKANVQVSFRHGITGIRHPTLPTRDKVVNFAQTFNTMELTEPVIIAVNTSGYESVPRIFTKFMQIASNRDKICGGIFDDPNDRDSFLGRRLRIQRLYNVITELKNVYTVYGYLPALRLEVFDSKLASTEGLANADLTTLQDVVTSYLEDPLKSVTIPSASELVTLDHDSPILACKGEVLGPQSDSMPGATRFHDVVDPQDFMYRLTRVGAVQFWSRHQVENLAVTYTHVDGSSPDEVVNHGDKTAPGQQSLFQLPAGIFFKTLTTAVDSQKVPPLQAVRMVLTNGLNVAASALHLGVNNTVNVADGTPVLGFQGWSSGSSLCELNMIIGQIYPATWEKSL